MGGKSSFVHCCLLFTVFLTGFHDTTAAYFNRLHPFIYTSPPNREDAFCSWTYCQSELSACPDILNYDDESKCIEDIKMIVIWSAGRFSSNRKKCCTWRLDQIRQNYLYCLYGLKTKQCTCDFTYFRWRWNLRVRHCRNGFKCNKGNDDLTDENCFAGEKVVVSNHTITD